MDNAVGWETGTHPLEAASAAWPLAVPLFAAKVSVHEPDFSYTSLFTRRNQVLFSWHWRTAKTTPSDSHQMVASMQRYQDGLAAGGRKGPRQVKTKAASVILNTKINDTAADMTLGCIKLGPAACVQHSDSQRHRQFLTETMCVHAYTESRLD